MNTFELTKELAINLLSIYSDNEEQNNHAENAALLSRYFGTDEQFRVILAINTVHDYQRHALPDTLQLRDSITSPMYQKLRKIAGLL
jgi:hypothetical protein